MTEDIRRGLTQAIRGRFGLPIYGQEVPQGGKRPCFTVEIAEIAQKQLLGRRCSRKVTFLIRYYCGEKKTAAAEALRIADGLYEGLRIIGEEEKFAAAGIRHEKTADGLEMTVSYEYHILYDADEAMMERLEYNERKAVGYEEESDLQQKTADGE